MLVYKRTTAAMERWGKVLEDELARIMRSLDLVASGRTVSSIKGEVVVDGTKIKLNINAESNKGVSVIDVLDTGQKPSQAKWPAGAIEQWIRDRGLTPRRKGRFVRATDTNIKRSAYAIARAIRESAIARAIRERGTIKRFGYGGANLYEQVFAPRAQAIGDDIASSYAADVEEHIDNITGAK